MSIKLNTNQSLLDRVLSKRNMNAAYLRVKNTFQKAKLKLLVRFSVKFTHDECKALYTRSVPKNKPSPLHFMFCSIHADLAEALKCRRLGGMLLLQQDGTLVMACPALCFHGKEVMIISRGLQ